jgi:propionyl-CoA synthetase
MTPEDPAAPAPVPVRAWAKLGAAAGLCASCLHARLNETRRGTAYLRCGRAAYDSRLPRYPRLPVTECAGYEPAPAE